MRIWDISPGYLSRQSLLGEHRELHAVVSIIEKGKKGYSRHPETLRWKGFEPALRRRHRLLAAEMTLRNYRERSPVTGPEEGGGWPELFIDEPARQFEILREKYGEEENGRIPLPENVQQLWSQHKYSVLARDEKFCRGLGPELARGAGPGFSTLARMLTMILRREPPEGGIRNALQHMWGHLRDSVPGGSGDFGSGQLRPFLEQIQRGAIETENYYLISSTALGELMAWIPDR
jgi:hypothetical protein